MNPSHRTTKGPTALRVFIACCEADREMAEELCNHLATHERAGQIAVSHVGQIPVGDDARAWLSQRIMDAEVALALVSASFLGPSGCMQVEVPLLRARAGLRIVPVIIGACPWRAEEWLRGRQPVPRDGKPIRPRADRDEAWTEVSEAVAAMARDGRSDADRAIVRYLDAMAQQQDEALEADLGRLFPDALGEAERHTLDELYVELEAEPGFAGLHGDGVTVPSLVEQVPGARFALLGEPGSGKTTLLRHLALTRARQALSAIGRGEAPGRAAIPILIPLRDLHDDRDDPFAHVERELRHELDLPPGLGPLLEQAAGQGRGLLLLDGLDEVPPEQVERRCKRLKTLVNRAELAASTIILSARTSGYLPPSPSFRRLRLLPLSPGSQVRLLTKWLSPGDAAVEALSRHLQSTASLAYLAGNPFFLTLIALLSRSKAAAAGGAGERWLPSSRPALLLREAVEALLDGAPRSLRDATRRPELVIHHRSSVRPVLEDLALALLEQGAGPYGDKAIAKLLRAPGTEAEGLIRQWPESPTPERFLSDLTGRTMLVVRDAGRARGWRFLHRSVQEHLSACALSRRGAEDWTARARHLAKNPMEAGRWAETFALLVGELAGGGGKQTSSDKLLGILAKHNRDLALRALSSAGPGAVSGNTVAKLLSLERGRDAWQARRKVIESIPSAERFSATSTAVGLLSRVLEGTRHGADVYFIREALERIEREAEDEDARALARHALARLFEHFEAAPDLRATKVTILDAQTKHWVDRPYWSEPVKMPGGGEIRIGRLPVTNGLYELFDPRHVAERGIRKGAHAVDAYRDHPVVNVTWYEAHSFCLWLSTTNPGVRLLTEEEWEQAASGGAGQKLPWGKGPPDKARAHLGGEAHSTTRAGAYPAGEAPCGARDMVGNTWEWSADEVVDKSADTSVDKIRALRGGAWGMDAAWLAVADRSWFRANVQNGYIGLRCVWSAP